MVLLLLPILLCGQVDWSQLVISRRFVVDQKATNYDFTVDLFKVIRDINVDSKSRVSDIITSEEKDEIIGILRQPKIKKVTFLTDGTKEIVVEVPITGQILDLLTPKDVKVGQPVVKRYCPFCGQPWPEGRPVPPGITLLIKDEIKETFTGVIIDASSFDLRPVLLPRIIDESGHLIYGLPFADRSQVIGYGLLTYLSADDQLLVNERIGNHPLRIKAKGVTGGDIIISNRDARKVHGSKANLGLLKKCRVIVISGQL